MGGVQWCTREYLKTLELANLQPQVRTFETDRRFVARLARKFRPRPFRNESPPAFLDELVRDCQQPANSIVFLNNTSALALAPALRERLGKQAKLIFLSHGVENTDLVNSLRLSPDMLAPHMKTPRWLGEVIFEEMRQRSAIDGVVCISAEDTIFENWLGTPAQLFLPRTIDCDDLASTHRTNMIGTVSTLNHGPNLDGIRKLAAELDHRGGVTLRVVGGPASVGESLQNEFACIEYVGRLDDDQLRVEAATWCAFTNPIFCQARGASTKVATALGWGLAVLTTPIGSRGYQWNDSILPRATSVRHLAEMCAEAAAGDVQLWRERAIQLRALAPKLEQVAELLGRFVSQIAGQSRGVPQP
jgi:hypothetical protein